MEETKESTPVELQEEEKKEETVQAPLPEKKKRKLTATQLETLAEGRKKRWEKKHLKIDIPEEEEVKEPVKEKVQKNRKNNPKSKKSMYQVTVQVQNPQLVLMKLMTLVLGLILLHTLTLLLLNPQQ